MGTHGSLSKAGRTRSRNPAPRRRVNRRVPRINNRCRFKRILRDKSDGRRVAVK